VLSYSLAVVSACAFREKERGLACRLTHLRRNYEFQGNWRLYAFPFLTNASLLTITHAGVFNSVVNMLFNYLYFRIACLAQMS